MLRLASLGIAASAGGVGCDALPPAGGRRGSVGTNGPAAASEVAIRETPVRLARRPMEPAACDPALLRGAIALLYYPQAAHPLEVQEILHMIEAFGVVHAERAAGRPLLEVLLDSHSFDGYYKRTSAIADLLVPRRPSTGLSGFGVQTKGGKASIGTAPHQDVFYQVLGHVGVSSLTPVRVRGESYKLADGLRIALADFDMRQEIDFSASAFAYYVPPIKSWTNRFGEEVSFDRLASALVTQEVGGSCYNIHRLGSLVTLLGVDEVVPILGREVVESVRGTLSSASAKLDDTLNRRGLWPADWHYADHQAPGDSTSLDDLSATAHHLEWIASAPLELRPGRSAVESAARSLAAELAALDPAKIAYRRGPMLHAARALLMVTGANLDELTPERRPVASPAV